MKRYIKSNIQDVKKLDSKITQDLENAIANYVRVLAEDDEYSDYSSYKVECNYVQNYYSDGTDCLRIQVRFDGDLYEYLEGGQQFDLSEFGIDEIYVTEQHLDEFSEMLDNIIQKYNRDSYFEPYDYGILEAAVPVE